MKINEDGTYEHNGKIFGMPPVQTLNEPEPPIREGLYYKAICSEQ